MYYDCEVRASKTPGNILIVTVSGDFPSTPVILGRMSLPLQSHSPQCCFSVFTY